MSNLCPSPNLDQNSGKQGPNPKHGIKKETSLVLERMLLMGPQGVIKLQAVTLVSLHFSFYTLGGGSIGGFGPQGEKCQFQECRSMLGVLMEKDLEAHPRVLGVHGVCLAYVS